jgi:hypothetical protein
MEGPLFIKLCIFFAAVHEHHLHDFIESEAILGEVLLVSVYLHHHFAQALKISLFFLLLSSHLLLNESASEVGVVLKEGKQQFIENSFGEEKIVIGHDGLFIVMYKCLVVLCQF